MTLAMLDKDGTVVFQHHGYDLMEDAVGEVFWSAAQHPTLTRWELRMSHHMQVWERDPAGPNKKPVKKYPGPVRYEDAR